jgi:hypothetical protein
MNLRKKQPSAVVVPIQAEASAPAQIDFGALEARIRGITEGLTLALQVIRQEMQNGQTLK